MSSQAEMADGWEAALDQELADALHGLFDDRLGPAIAADMRTLVPVDTARLRDSLGHTVDDSGRLPELHVGSFPDDKGDVKYAAAVELGFHGVEDVRAHVRQVNGKTVQVRAHQRVANQPEEAYMRPALYQERDI
jgi:hypothetical protein